VSVYINAIEMKKPFDTIPIELRNKPLEYVETIQKINKELQYLKIPIQIKMTITEHRKSDWNKEENIYWEQSANAYNYLGVMDVPLNECI
jgi:hypothetical protein